MKKEHQNINKKTRVTKKMLNIEDEQMLQELVQTRNIRHSTMIRYRTIIKYYVESQGLPLHELILEAEKEEDQGIRLKNRTIKKRLINHRNYLINERNYSHVTVQKTMTGLRTIYNHFEIELPRIPKLNERSVKSTEPIYYDDLPTHELIGKAINLSKPIMKAVILFITSSGCARSETCSLTIQDFIEATSEYHNSENIYEVLEELKDQDNIVPIFHVKRQKTNKFYYTFCSPEAVTAIVSYLNSRTDNMTNDKKLFKINKNYLNVKFQELNEQLGGPNKGCYCLLRTHMLRKFHASNLARGENGLSLDEIDSLQGRTKDNVRKSYYFDDPKELRKKYIRNIDKVLINNESVKIDSPEVAALRKEAEKLKEENEIIKSNINKAVDDRINEVLSKYGF